MKREELKAQGLTAEQVDYVMAENGRDIERHKGLAAEADKIKSDLEKAKIELEKAHSAIKELEPLAKGSEEIQKRLADYEAKQAEMQAAQEHDKKIAEIKDRFIAAKGDKEFSLDYVERGLFDDFMKSLDDPTYKGKGDVEIFTSLVTGKDGLFKSSNPQGSPAKMTAITVGASLNPFAKETFNLTEQMKLFKDNPAQARSLATNAGISLPED